MIEIDEANTIKAWPIESCLTHREKTREKKLVTMRVIIL